MDAIFSDDFVLLSPYVHFFIFAVLALFIYVGVMMSYTYFFELEENGIPRKECYSVDYDELKGSCESYDMYYIPLESQVSHFYFVGSFVSVIAGIAAVAQFKSRKSSIEFKRMGT